MSPTSSELGAYINGLTEDATPDPDNDFLIEYDASASATKKVKVGNAGGGAGGGAPAAAKYITSESHADLSNEIVIPGLAGSADILPALAIAFQHEFETGDTLPTWTPGAPDTINLTTVKSHLFVKSVDTTDRSAYWDYAPAGDFDLQMKANVGLENYTGTPTLYWGLMAANADLSVRVNCISYTTIGGVTVGRADAYTYSGGGWTIRGYEFASADVAPMQYQRIKRVGGDFFWFYSPNGLVWQKLASLTFACTVARVGFRFWPYNGLSDSRLIVDWIRATE